jgi:peroxiredoxin
MRSRLVLRLLLLMVLMLPSPALRVTPARAAAAPQPAPGFTLRARKGTACLDSLRGKVVLVDFWASWCEPCQKSFPWLAAMQQKYAARGFVVVAIGLDKDLDAGDSFLAKHPAPFTVAFDPTGKTAEAYRVTGMPSTYLVDREGRIVHAHVGFVAGKTAEWEQQIEEASRP